MRESEKYKIWDWSPYVCINSISLFLKTVFEKKSI